MRIYHLFFILTLIILKSQQIIIKIFVNISKCYIFVKKTENMGYHFNVKNVYADLEVWLRDWERENAKGCKFIVGISGGKDSSVVATLLSRVFGYNRVIGVTMPHNGNQQPEAAELIKYLGIESYDIPIDDAYDGMMRSLHLSGLSADAVTVQTRNNLPPRLRMAALYAVAQSRNGRVVNTCNLSENWVGYSTLYGDAAGDFSPLANLTVHEVRSLGRFLGLPDHFVDVVPTDGLCGKSDEDNLGFTYEVLDDYIRHKAIPERQVRSRIDELHAKNLFKVSMRPEFLPNMQDIYQD